MQSRERFNSENTSQDSGWDTLYREQAIRNGMTAPERFRQEKANGGRLIQDITANGRWDTRYRNEAINNGMTAASRFEQEKARKAREANFDPEEAAWYQEHLDKIGDLISDGDTEKEQWYREHPDKIWQLLADRNNRREENVEPETIESDDAAPEETDGSASPSIESNEEENIPINAVEPEENVPVNSALPEENIPVDSVELAEDIPAGGSGESEGENVVDQSSPEEENESPETTELTVVENTTDDKKSEERFSEDDKDRLARKLERAVRNGKMSVQHAESLAEKQLGRSIATPEQDEAYFAWLKQHDEENNANLNKPERNTRVVNVKYGENGEVWRDVAANVIDNLKKQIENGNLSEADRVRIAEFLTNGINSNSNNQIPDNANGEGASDSSDGENGQQPDVEGGEKDAIESGEKDVIESEEKDAIEAKEKDAIEAEERDAENEPDEDTERSPERTKRTIKERLAEIKRRLKEIFSEKAKAKKRIEEIDREIEAIKEKRRARGVETAERHSEPEAVTEARKKISELDEQIRDIKSGHEADTASGSGEDNANGEPLDDLEKARRINERIKKIDAEREVMNGEIERIKARLRAENNPDDAARLQALRGKAEEHRLEAVKLRDEMSLYIHSAEDLDRINNPEA